MAGLFGARMKKPPYFVPTPIPASPTPTTVAPFMPSAFPVAPGTTGTTPVTTTMPDSGFKKPSTLQTIAGIIGDSVAQWQGGQPLFAQTQAMRQKAVYDAAQAQRERANKFADWQSQYDYEIAHPKPANNDTANDYNFWLTNFGQEAADQWKRNQLDPIIPVRNSDGTVTPVRRSDMSGAANPQPAPPGVTFTPLPATGGAGSGPQTFQPSAVLDAVIGQESGGRAGVKGPMTKYGQALGLSQLLPGTAKEMAGKMGVPWRPDLLTGTTPEAAQYQRALGQAYLSQGYDSTGSVKGALSYYHGGPNKALWGPKTRSYVNDVLSRLGVK